MDIAAGLASLDAAIKIATGLRQLEKAYDQVALKGQVVDLMGSLYDVKGQLIEASQALAQRDAEISRLTDALAVKARLVDGPGGYKWVDQGEGLRLGYPVCPTCLDQEGRQVTLMQDDALTSVKCPRCKSAFAPVQPFLEPEPDGTQKTAQQDRADKMRASREGRTAGRRGSWMG